MANMESVNRIIDFRSLNQDLKGVDIRIPEVERYAHEYDRWLDFFAMLAKLTRQIIVENPPMCWVPFIRYLGHDVRSPQIFFELADTLHWNDLYFAAKDKRRAVEMASACRPELVHALYLADTLWPCPRIKHEKQDSFVVTTNGSLYRREFLEYLEGPLREYKPAHRKCVIVPCSVYKPYPSPLHRKVRERLGVDWEIITCSGAIGLAPEALWGVMPEYDSGFPYMPRVVDTVSWYFGKHKRYRSIVVYSDFYAHWIAAGLHLAGGERKVHYCFGTHYRTEYANLMHVSSLNNLERAARALEG